MKNEKELDNLIQKWSTARRRGDAELRPLARRIAGEAVGHQKRRAAAQKVADKNQKRWLAPALGWAGGLAVVALIVAGVFLHDRPIATIEAENGDPAEIVSVDMSHEKLAKSRKLFDELEHIFAGQFRWIVEHNGRVDLGIGQMPGSASDDSKPVKYRLTVVAKSTSESGWRAVWSTDVLLRSEEIVQISRTPCDSDKLTLWVYPLQDGKVLVDADLSLASLVGIVSQTSHLQPSGLPTEIFSLQKNDMEYRVLQTVSVLENLS